MAISRISLKPLLESSSHLQAFNSLVQIPLDVFQKHIFCYLSRSDLQSIIQTCLLWKREGLKYEILRVSERLRATAQYIKIDPDQRYPISSIKTEFINGVLFEVLPKNAMLDLPNASNIRTLQQKAASVLSLFLIMQSTSNQERATALVRIGIEYSFLGLKAKALKVIAEAQPTNEEKRVVLDTYLKHIEFLIDQDLPQDALELGKKFGSLSFGTDSTKEAPLFYKLCCHLLFLGKKDSAAEACSLIPQNTVEYERIKSYYLMIICKLLANEQYEQVRSLAASLSTIKDELTDQFYTHIVSFLNGDGQQLRKGLRAHDELSEYLTLKSEKHAYIKMRIAFYFAKFNRYDKAFRIINNIPFLHIKADALKLLLPLFKSGNQHVPVQRTLEIIAETIINAFRAKQQSWFALKISKTDTQNKLSILAYWVGKIQDPKKMVVNFSIDDPTEYELFVQSYKQKKDKLDLEFKFEFYSTDRYKSFRPGRQQSGLITYIDLSKIQYNPAQNSYDFTMTIDIE